MAKIDQIKTGFDSSRTNPSERIKEHNEKIEAHGESVQETISEAKRMHETITAVGLQIAGGKDAHSTKRSETDDIKENAGMIDKARIIFRNIVSFGNEGKRDKTYKEVAGRIVDKEIAKLEKELGGKVVKKKEELKKMVKEKEAKIKFLTEQVEMMESFGGKDEVADLLAKVQETKDGLDELISEQTQPSAEEEKLKSRVDDLIAPSLDKMKEFDKVEIKYSSALTNTLANEKKCRETLKEINKAKGKFDAGRDDVKSKELEKVLNDRLAEAEAALKKVEKEKADLEERLNKVRADKDEVGEYMHRLNCIGKTDKEKGVINKERNEKRKGSKTAIKDYISTGRSDDYYWNWSSESSYGSFNDYVESVSPNFKLAPRDITVWLGMMSMDFATELDFQHFVNNEIKTNSAIKIDGITEDQMNDIFSRFCKVKNYTGKDAVMGRIGEVKKKEFLDTDGKELEEEYRNTL